jgi:hypothetical protein
LGCCSVSAGLVFIQHSSTWTLVHAAHGRADHAPLARCPWLRDGHRRVSDACPGAERLSRHTVVHPGDTAVSVVGTPFHLVFKSVACGASVAIAAPVAGNAALRESRYAPEVRRELGDGANQNCGPRRPEPLPRGLGGGAA